MAPGFASRSGYMGLLVDKFALGQDFSEDFGFPYQSSFHFVSNRHLGLIPPHPKILKK
jgi:hypothetical protein